MNTPSPRVWMATFVALVFSIGILTGIVVDRTVLNSRAPGVQGSRGPGLGPGAPGGRGPDGSRRGGPGRPGPGGPGRGGPFGPPPEIYIDELSREVTLSDVQRADILKLLEAQETRMRELQENARKVFVDEQTALHDRIASVLTPDQATTFRNWVHRRIGARGR